MFMHGDPPPYILLITIALAFAVLYGIMSIPLYWHQRINSWPLCTVILTNNTTFEISTGNCASAQANVTAVCDTHELPALLKYPPEPQGIYCTSVDSVTKKVAEWTGNLTAHVDPDETDLVHTAFVSPPNIILVALAVALFAFCNLGTIACCVRRGCRSSYTEL